VEQLGKRALQTTETSTNKKKNQLKKRRRGNSELESHQKATFGQKGERLPVGYPSVALCSGNLTTMPCPIQRLRFNVQHSKFPLPHATFSSG